MLRRTSKRNGRMAYHSDDNYSPLSVRGIAIDCSGHPASVFIQMLRIAAQLARHYLPARPEPHPSGFSLGVPGSFCRLGQSALGHSATSGSIRAMPALATTPTVDEALSQARKAPPRRRCPAEAPPCRYFMVIAFKGRFPLTIA